MSSFRVERDRVSVFPQAIVIGAQTRPAQGVPPSPPPDEARRPDPAPGGDGAAESALEQAQRLHEEARKERAAAEAEAKRILETARAKADKLAEDAQESLRQARAEAKEHGYSEGLRQAYEENAARKKREATELEKMMTDIRRERVEIIESLRGEIIGLVVEITRQIMNIKLKESDEAFLNVVNTQLSKIKQSESVTISLSTEDYIRYFFGAPDGQNAFGDRNARVVENKGFQPGDCVIESDSEIVDCGITGQLRRIEQMLMDEEEATAANGGDK